MMIELERSGGVWVFHVGTNLDAASAPDMHRRIETLPEGAPYDCVVDLTDAEFMDSSGVGVLVRLFRRVSGDGGRLCICGANGQPRSLIGTLKIETAIPLHRDLATAIKSFQPR